MSESTIGQQTEAELLEILRNLKPPKISDEPGTFTSGELRRITGMTYYRCRLMINSMLESGEIKRTKISRVNGWGERRMTCGYRIESEANENGST